ncbi:MAG: class I SAM-dependent methyltransferase [Pseudonocardiaceae bacterium]
MKAPKAAERLVWAVDAMDVSPADRLLEIGCGHGVAVSLVCQKLDGGSVTAIDRSPKMIAKAAKRNADHVAAGVASFQTASLHDADFGDARFDKIFAIHVPVFLRGQPDRELEIVRKFLAPDGRFFLPYQPLIAEQAKPTARTLSATLDRQGFTVIDVVIENLPSGRVGCVIAR